MSGTRSVWPRRIREVFGCLLLVAALALIISLRPGPAEPTWHDQTVGKSIVRDVDSALGEPTVSDYPESGTIVYYYRGTRFEWATHKITFKNGVVDSIREDTAVYHPETIYFKSYVEKYGNPDDVYWSTFSK